MFINNLENRDGCFCQFFRQKNHFIEFFIPKTRAFGVRWCVGLSLDPSNEKKKVGSRLLAFGVALTTSPDVLPPPLLGKIKSQLPKGNRSEISEFIFMPFSSHVHCFKL